VNAISLFGANATPGAWVEIVVGLSALTMASALPDWPWQARLSRPVSVWFPVGGLLCLAMTSAIVGIMHPELFAAAFGVI
jgi:hypothetical protein